MIVLRYSVAGPTPPQAATFVGAMGIPCTVTPCWGASSWGVEEGVVVEAAHPEPDIVDNVIRQLLLRFGQDAAYRTVDGGAPSLIWNDGRITVLEAA